MNFIKISIYASALNFIILGLASAYYFVIPQMYFWQDETFATLYYKCPTCSIAKENAAIDFKKGEYQVVFWGLGNIANNKIFRLNLLANYKTKAISGGCVPLSEMNCYSIKMQQLLFKKYGNNFIFNTYKKADSLDNLSQKNWSQ
ncbi:hypothetical protein FA048_14205 [Pedobacter polaris]|uniref:Uncharacterized protein n=1 Tax=Pedobacter polaris TaxID=2571273 RepID=A0A4V5NZF2_9SPHI|nr:hypothetical protein [Pedobacter polaris]TKC08305.1 hypothetical protein FA048_14205 [Pedobacter polaris]